MFNGSAPTASVVTLWRRVLFEKLMVTQLVKKFPTTCVHQSSPMSLTRASWIQSTP